MLNGSSLNDCTLFWPFFLWSGANRRIKGAWVFYRVLTWQNLLIWKGVAFTSLWPPTSWEPDTHHLNRLHKHLNTNMTVLELVSWEFGWSTHEILHTRITVGLSCCEPLPTHHPELDTEQVYRNSRWNVEIESCWACIPLAMSKSNSVLLWVQPVNQALKPHDYLDSCRNKSRIWWTGEELGRSFSSLNEWSQGSAEMKLKQLC